MKPDTSHWRDGQSYDYFDALSVEGLAWECLRRNETYQELYGALVIADAETIPLPQEAEQRWGLRFRGEAWGHRVGAGCSVVPTHRSGRCHSDAAARVPGVSIHSLGRRHRRASR